MSIKKLRIPASMLVNGDVITSSGRYKSRVRGEVKIATAGNGMVFLETPTLPEEDVAFRDGDTVDVDREQTE